jgi:MFS transporter, DHA2 family, multidrug resistance protein
MSASTDSHSPPSRAGLREWSALAVLALTAMLLSLDVSVLYLALPQLASDLGASATEQLWILDIYSFVLAGFLLTMGNVGDRIGRRRLLFIGAVAFGVASVVAAYATSPGVLIASRAVLGIAGATLMPSSMALLRTIFPHERQMGTAVGVWYCAFMGGMALGPLVGGVLLSYFWWGSAFLLGVPFMVLILLAGPALLPESRGSFDTPLDLLSVALSLGSVLPLVYGLKHAAEGGHPAESAVAVVVGVAVGALFLLRQRRSSAPLLDLRLFRSGVFVAALAVMLVGGFVMAGVSLLSTQYLQLVAGLSPMTAGLWMLPENVALLAGTIIGPVLARRLSTAATIAVGLAISSLGLALHVMVDSQGGLPLLVAGTVLAAFGVILPAPVATALLMSSAPPENTGAVASLSESSGEFGIAVGVAAMGSTAALVYQASLDDHAGALPGATVEAAQESLAAALQIAATLPEDVGAQLTAAARDAFTEGLNVVSGVGAVLFLGLAATIYGVLRTRHRPSAAAHERPVPEPAGTVSG